MLWPDLIDSLIGAAISKSLVLRTALAPFFLVFVYRHSLFLQSVYVRVCGCACVCTAHSSAAPAFNRAFLASCRVNLIESCVITRTYVICCVYRERDDARRPVYADAEHLVDEHQEHCRVLLPAHHSTGVYCTVRRYSRVYILQVK